MKVVEYFDDDGRQRISIVRNEDENLTSEGIKIEPPPFDDILEEAKIALHNELVRRRIFTYMDLSKRPEELEASIRSTITNKIVLRLKEKQNNKE
jgi:hypothetical protein